MSGCPDTTGLVRIMHRFSSLRSDEGGACGTSSRQPMHNPGLPSHETVSEDAASQVLASLCNGIEAENLLQAGDQRPIFSTDRGIQNFLLH